MTTKQKSVLKISGSLALPLGLAADSMAILARKGRGKTYAASVLAEEMLDANVPICVLDPQGDWWGLRSSASGKRGGYPVIIMGGEHGDIPLEPTSGKLVADFVLNERVPTILDMSEFSTRADEQRFGVAFMERLFRGKKRETGVLHLFVDEASTFAPQIVKGDDAKLEGASRNIARRGRTRGLGSSWIDQRAASVNKNVLSQMAGIIVLGITGKHDRTAIKEWVDAKAADDEQLRTMLEELPGLQKGGAYTWVPDLNIFERVQIRKRRTFDSSKTPEPGEMVQPPRSWSDIDTDALARSMAETIERVKAEDPKELRRRIAQLEKELKTRPTERETIEVPVEIPVPLLEPSDVDRLDKILEGITKAGAQIGDQVDALMGAAATFRDHLQKVQGDARDISRTPRRPVSRPQVKRQNENRAAVSRPSSRDISRPDGEDPDALSAYGIGLLEALARQHPMKLTRTQLAMFAGRKHRSSAFSAAMVEITRVGYIQKDGTLFKLSDAGWAVVGNEPPAPMTAEEGRATWLRNLPDYEADLLRAILDAYPGGLDREQLSEATGRSRTSSAFSAAIQTLKRNDLVTESAGELIAQSWLFS